MEGTNRGIRGGAHDTDRPRIEAKIERYREMLRNGNFTLSQRETIEELLAEEEAKLAELLRPSEQDC